MAKKWRQAKRLFNVLCPLAFGVSGMNEISSRLTQNDSVEITDGGPVSKFSLYNVPIKYEVTGSVLLGVSCGNLDASKSQSRKAR
jgi:hypothetical protein